MTKRNKIIYWIATIWLSFGMLFIGIIQVMQLKEETAFILALGYPSYFLPLIGIWKILGVIALLVPRFPVIKEWAYAGFFFTATGALYSHIAHGSEPGEMTGPVLILVLTLASWYFRPAGRKVAEL